MNMKETKWERCSNDAWYNSQAWDGSESWTILVHKVGTDGTLCTIGLGYEERDSDGNWETGFFYEEGVFTGTSAYEEACEAWNFDS